jgi:capsular polysaccharide biosynthesis protein
VNPSRRRVRGRDAATVEAYPRDLTEISDRYGGWANQGWALRAALREDACAVEEHASSWRTWLSRHGLDTRWLPRISVDDESRGSLVTLRPGYEFSGGPPRVYGSVDDPDQGRAIRFSSDGERYWRVRRGRVVGGWDVAETPAGACWPALTPSTADVLVSNALDEKLLGWTPSSFIVRDDTSSPTTVRLRSAIALVGEHSTKFGHWMLDYVARALSARTTPPAIPVLIDAGMPENCRWWLDAILPGRAIISVEAGQVVRAKTLYVALPRTFCPTGWHEPIPMTRHMWWIDGPAATQIQEIVTRDRPARPRHRRLWLVRRDASRRLVNEADLLDGIESLGFDTLRLEHLGMNDAQALLDETAIVVCPIGSVLNNLVATGPGLRVVVLIGSKMHHYRGSVAALLESLGHDYAFVGGHEVGPAPRTPFEAKQSNYRIDGALLREAITDLEPTTTRREPT